jgi:hypothetical protein
MNDAVIWPDAMINALALQYVEARSAGFGTAFTRAIQRIEERLSSDPLEDTESRGEGIRVIFESPATVYFRIENDGYHVTILHLLFVRPRVR